jgi:hypothetical protein
MRHALPETGHLSQVGLWQSSGSPGPSSKLLSIRKLPSGGHGDGFCYNVSRVGLGSG